MASESLLKVLSEAGIASRRKLTEAIKQGRVTVNGQVVDGFRFPVDSARDRVALDGRAIGFQTQSSVYLLLNKPAGVLSTTHDERGRKTVLSLLPPKYRHLRLYPVGRLDLDSTGLLLLTNDGDLTYHLTHPRFEHEKEYLVAIDGGLSPEEKRKLEQGIELDGKRTAPATVREVKNLPPFNYSITLHEGRKRQLRRMLAALGYRVQHLKRVRMGSLGLGSLREGAVRELDKREVRALTGGKH
ncbi:MAG: pseudouridine synthase [Dehalococcoidales bacterium]|nr:pseudouridine synthase [Dehalococcoidales bacterium]